MITYRIKYKHFISQLYVPASVETRTRVIIMLPGLPMSFQVRALIDQYLKRSDYVFYPFYSGTYDSGGVFTGESAVNDVRYFLRMVQQDYVQELYYNKKIILPRFSEIILVGMSFSAVIVLHADLLLCNKVVLLSPVLIYDQTDINNIVNGFDFKNQMNCLIKLLCNAYPFTYRMDETVPQLRDFLYGVSRYSRTQQIMDKLGTIQVPTLLVHGLSDNVVPIKLTETILENAIENKNITFNPVNHVGHSLSSYGNALLHDIASF